MEVLIIYRASKVQTFKGGGALPSFLNGGGGKRPSENTRILA